MTDIIDNTNKLREYSSKLSSLTKIGDFWSRRDVAVSFYIYLFWYVTINYWLLLKEYDKLVSLVRVTGVSIKLY
jgi:hypothetical protein